MRRLNRLIGNLLLGLLSAIEAWVTRNPQVIREYRHQFGNGIVVRVKLSSRYPRFQAIFSEPLPSWWVESWHEERARILALYKAESGIAISDAELIHESHRSI